MTHTPAPWKANNNQIEAVSRLHTIICTTGGTGYPFATSGKPEEARANAFLIAAAPELLAELKNNRAALQLLLDSTALMGAAAVTKAIILKRIQAADMAINKAEGK